LHVSAFDNRARWYGSNERVMPGTFLAVCQARKQNAHMRKMTDQKAVRTWPGMVLLLHLLFALNAAAQPANDNCANANTINITGNGFGVGVFTSSSDDITRATLQPGESFAPAIIVAGQDKKSIWYKFMLPTTRGVKVTLAQSGTTIPAGDVGFAVYKANSCLPTSAQISTKLTPIGLFGNTYHPCVDSGVYYVQVSAKSSASGPVNIQVETSLPTAAYDQPKQAGNYGTLEKGVYSTTFDVDCQSIEDATEVCTGLANSSQYTKSSWHVFKTPAYFDFIVLMLAQQSSASQTIGFNIYEGDVRTASYKTLPVVVQCDSFVTSNTYFSRKHFKCDKLQYNKTYSVQLFFHHSFNDKVKLSLALNGTAPTQAPVPVLAGMPSPSNNLGTLPSDANGKLTTVSDQLACNSRHSVTACGPSIQKEGFWYAPYSYLYNLSSFFTFKLSSSSNISFYTSQQECSGNFYLRLYRQGPTAKCSDLDTVNIIGQGVGSINATCLPAGEYTLQVMGRDTTNPEWYYSFNSFGDGHYPYSYCFQENLGTKFSVSMNVRTVNAGNRFSLNKPGAFDTINNVAGTIKPMVSGVTYTSKTDTIGCANTVLPSDTSCAPENKKAVYRQMLVGENGILSFTPNYYWGKLYQGDANALATAQNAFTFPAQIRDLKAYSECVSSNDCNGVKACVVPGTYTYVTFASDAHLSATIQPSFTFSNQGTKYATLATAEDLGTITESKTSSADIFGCKDNVVDIPGYQPCQIRGKAATKAIYRQFYLSKDSRISISGYHYLNCGYGYSGYMSLFYGKAAEGAAGLKPVGGIYNCFQSVSPDQCDVLPAGWYTLISYGSGPSFEEPMRDLWQYGYSSYVGYQNQVSISVLPACPLPKYNRPAKAAIDTLTNQPFLVQWGPRVGHTAAYPKTDTTYNLYRENFNCTVDTPFLSHPVPSCDASLVKVAYYVFRTTQESYVQIDTKGFWAAVYAGNARNGTGKFDSTTLIQPCIASYGKIQLCRLQAGVYTLVVFGKSTDNCTPVEPTVYIDQVGYSRFDHATKAYDFGVVPPDSLYHKGKVGDVNPLNAARAPSNDFFYCTTGAQKDDPAQPTCGTDYLPGIYKTGVNNALYPADLPYSGNEYIPRRNLWYTFVVKEGGNIKIKVSNKTIGKQYQYRFAVYKSDVDGTLPFSQVVSSGAVDSTAAQGLQYITGNQSWWYCSYVGDEVSFYRDPCSATPERYYILVENTNSYPFEWGGMKPNSQVEVAILVDSINAVAPKFDHYYQAGNIGSSIGAGTYKGATDNYSCATKDATDPGHYYSCAEKTLWYKFTTTVTGRVQFRIVVDGKTSYYSHDRVQLFRQVVPGDSTQKGLQFVSNNNNYVYDNATQAYWGSQCISPGTYYLFLTGCYEVNGYVHPEIKIEEDAGDFCSAPMVTPLSGPGSNVKSVTIDCHTIGTDYGEFNPTLTCPNGGKVSDYKTSWFRIDITGKDTLDVTTFLTNKTNALSANIKYRMMNGNCGAMQERSCVQDAQTRDTYKCLPPGSYFIQVFTPVTTTNGYQTTGSIDLNLSAVKHVDTCAKMPACLSNASFQYEYDCTKSDEVAFVNYSTYGSSIRYKWDFGYSNQTSTAVSPKYIYPVLSTSKTYRVTLTVTNTECGETSTYTQDITWPAKGGAGK
jgi:hypothetical protein